MKSALALFVLACSSLLACGGEASSSSAPNDDATSTQQEPVARATPLFALRVDDREVEHLEAPTGTLFVPSENGSRFVTISAQQDPRGSDYIRVAQILLPEPFAAGTYACTRDENGRPNGSVSFDPGDFLGFTPTLTDCLVTVDYVSEKRAVGSFSANAHPPAGSSLEGQVSTIDGEFDVPLEEHAL